jgi:uncharacterized protein (TIGR02588 family)
MRQNWLEWVALAVSVTAIVGLVGFLVVDGLVDEGRPPAPRVTLRTTEAYAIESGWLVPVTLSNDGDEAAEAVDFVATATVAGEEEEATVSVDYLPAGTDVEITFGFSAEPEGELVVHVVGFRVP